MERRGILVTRDKNFITVSLRGQDFPKEIRRPIYGDPYANKPKQIGVRVYTLRSTFIPKPRRRSNLIVADDESGWYEETGIYVESGHE